MLSCQKDSEIIANIDNQLIEFDDFIDHYKEFLLFTSMNDNLQTRTTFINSEIDKYLLLNHAELMDFHNNKNVRDEIKKAQDQVLLNNLYENEIENKITVSDFQIREAFRRSKIELHARHLFSRTNEGVNDIELRLKNNETFENIAKDIFIDEQLAESGGDLGYFNYGETDSDFEDAAYSLKDGEISKPIKTKFGYSIIQIIDRNIEPFVTENDYQLHKDKFESFEKQKLLKKEIITYTDELVKSLRIDISETCLNLIFENLENLDSVLDCNIIRFEGGSWDFDEFVNKFLFVSEKQKRQIKDSDDLHQVISGLIVRDAMLQKSKRYITESVNKKLEFVKNQTIVSLLVDEEISRELSDTKIEYFDFVNKLKSDAKIIINKELLTSFVL